MILVTGGCGFIGANLIPKLIDCGHKIRVLDDLSKGSLSYLDGVNVDFVEGDIRDRNVVRQSLKGVDGVIHLAAFGSVVESVQNPEENFDINVRGTFTLLDECRKAGVEQLVFSSTGGALIGNATPPVDESSVPKPISPYGSGKLCCEAYCSSFSSSYGMDITALRFANVIGPISWHKKGAVTAFMKCIMAGQDIKIYGDGSATRDFLYVDDLCDGIISAYERRLPGFNAIHLASGQEVSVKQLAQIILEQATLEEVAIEYLPKRIGEVERNFANFNKAHELLAFSPKTSLEDAVSITWKWFLEKYS